MNNWILIIVLALMTYSSRVMGLELMSGRNIRPSFRLYLNYVPIAIISALVIKEIFTVENGRLTFSPVVFFACLLAALIMKKSSNLLLSILSGILFGVGLRFFL